MDMVTIIGILGVVGILTAFILNEVHVWSEDDVIYDVVNLIGAVLLTVYSALIDSLPFAVLNGIWAIVSLRDVITYGISRGKREQ